jgi:hypothetical protein
MDSQLIILLLYVAKQCTIYIGSFLLIAGLFGNVMNIIIFSSLRIYRTTPCTFYFLIGSIFNGLYILLDLTSLITAVGFGIDSTGTSRIWCKVGPFFSATLSLVTFTCSCLAAIDQFLATSRNVNLRFCSNIKWAYRIIFIVIFASCLHGIPCLVYFDIIGISKLCEIINTTYAIYIPIFFFVLLCVTPIFIMILFGCLTYRNIRQTIVLAEQHADRQVTRMIFIQVILVVISNTPNSVYTAYGLITKYSTKDYGRQAKEYLTAVIITLFSYSYYILCLLFFIIYCRAEYFSILFRAISTCS